MGHSSSWRRHFLGRVSPATLGASGGLGPAVDGGERAALGGPACDLPPRPWPWWSSAVLPSLWQGGPWLTWGGGVCSGCVRDRERDGEGDREGGCPPAKPPRGAALGSQLAGRPPLQPLGGEELSVAPSHRETQPPLNTPDGTTRAKEEWGLLSTLRRERLSLSPAGCGSLVGPSVPVTPDPRHPWNRNLW